MSEWIYENAVGNIIASDYNDFYSAATGFYVQGVGSYTFSEWQRLGYDAHSITSNPALSSSYVPQSGSPVIGAGTNLTSTCSGQPNPGLGALCYDAAGNPRPVSGAWTTGAYNYVSNGPAPPTGLSAVPH